jgi:hypothetical protein
MTAAAMMAAATTPDRKEAQKAKRPPDEGGRFSLIDVSSSNYNHLGAHADAAVQIDHILIAHPDAAG